MLTSRSSASPSGCAGSSSRQWATAAWAAAAWAAAAWAAAAWAAAAWAAAAWAAAAWAAAAWVAPWLRPQPLPPHLRLPYREALALPARWRRPPTA